MGEKAIDDEGDFPNSVDEMLHDMIAAGAIRTIYDPIHRDLIFFYPEQEPRFTIESN